MAPSSDESFLARWSRLKRRPVEAKERSQIEPPLNDGEASLDVPERGEGALLGDDLAEDAQAREDGQAEGTPSKRNFADFDFDQLDYGSDYRQFMKDDVPEDARNKALRRLWTSNPVLANMDGLDDYCEDYTDAAVVPIGPLKTAYKIGRGFLSDTEVAEWEALGCPENTKVALADEGEATGEGDAGRATHAAEAQVDDPEWAEGAGETVTADAGAAVADTEAFSCPGSACAAAVRREEEQTLEDYESERAAKVENRAGEADGAGGCARRDKG